MSSTDTASPRAQLVEGLWQLKQVSEQQDDHHLHFNTLLKDPDYREEIIQRASTSKNPKIRALARELRALDSREVLVSRNHTAASRLSLNPDVAATQAQQGFVGVDSAGVEKGRQRRLLVPSLLTVLLVIAAATTWLLRDSLGLSSNHVAISGSLFGDHRWTANKQWVLEDIVYLEAGARLVIEPGTQVLGKNGSALIVTRDAILHARGKADAPIVFSSARPTGSRKAGDWGGLVMLGNAPVNVSDARIEGVPEGDTRAAFGGVDPTANCGVLEYARIEFAGFEAYANNELNGLTLGGCGSNTIIRNVQVHSALDDGVEVFGGTVDLKNILITGAGDDSLDWDLGWRGRVQFLIVQQHPGVGDNAFEGDNNGKDHLAAPASEPTFYNVTLISSGNAEKYQRAMTLREGTGGHFNNVIVQGFSGELVDIRDESTVTRIKRGELSFNGLVAERIGDRSQSSLFFSNESSDETGSQSGKDDDGGFSEIAYFNTLETVRLGGDAGLTDRANNRLDPDFVPLLRSRNHASQVSLPQGEFWDEAAAYLGAVRPGVKQSWTEGWAAFPAS